MVSFTIDTHAIRIKFQFSNSGRYYFHASHNHLIQEIIIKCYSSQSVGNLALAHQVNFISCPVKHIAIDGSLDQFSRKRHIKIILKDFIDRGRKNSGALVVLFAYGEVLAFV